jgi:mannose/cellobiose epimerase-like protein (N-acyl-D-glucosamine 2-epimerase family)
LFPSRLAVTFAVMMNPLSFLLTQVLPFWAERAFDPQHGGYFTELSPEGHPVAEEKRLCLVQTRMLYTFSHAYCLSRESWAIAAAERALDFMTRRLRRPDGAFAAMVSLDEDGARADLVDFYDQAFVLFSLAWWYRASGDPAALQMAHAAIAALDFNLRDPVNGGWQEANLEQALRRQNPHMHLLEAMLAWYEATGDEAWIVPVREIMRLFRERFFDSATGTLREFLAPDLLPLSGRLGQIREPGHHFEWVWLLSHYGRLINEEDVSDLAEQLYQTARQHGVDRNGLVVEAIDPHGVVLEPGRLLWPQTEAIKAALARSEFLNAEPADADAFLSAMMRTHFPSSEPLWINHVSSEGEPLSRRVPTRLLYHITLCIAEYARLRG